MTAQSVSFETQRAALADVVAIPVTPFAEDGSVDEAACTALLKRLLDAGVRTLTPNGNTGEFYTLTPQERRRVTELTLAEAGERAAILVGVGHDVPTAVDAARHARDLGAHMVMVHQPVHPYVSDGGWVDYHRAIAEAVPEIGVVPYLKNAALPGARLAELLGGRHRLHLGPGERRPQRLAVHDRSASIRGLPGRHEGLGADPPLRGAARRRRLREQRHRRQGGPRLARPVPP
jgi:hypothetical protein